MDTATESAENHGYMLMLPAIERTAPLLSVWFTRLIAYGDNSFFHSF